MENLFLNTISGKYFQKLTQPRIIVGPPYKIQEKLKGECPTYGGTIAIPFQNFEYFYEISQKDFEEIKSKLENEVTPNIIEFKGQTHKPNLSSQNKEYPIRETQFTKNSRLNH